MPIALLRDCVPRAGRPYSLLHSFIPLCLHSFIHPRGAHALYLLISVPGAGPETRGDGSPVAQVLGGRAEPVSQTGISWVLCRVESECWEEREAGWGQDGAEAETGQLGLLP